MEREYVAGPSEPHSGSGTVYESPSAGDTTVSMYLSSSEVEYANGSSDHAFFHSKQAVIETQVGRMRFELIWISRRFWATRNWRPEDVAMSPRSLWLTLFRPSLEKLNLFD